MTGRMTRRMAGRAGWDAFVAMILVTSACGQSGGDQSGGGHTGHADHHDHADHRRGPDVVSLSPETIESTGIRVETVRAERLVGGIDVPAEIQLNPDRTAHVSPLVSGWIAEVKAALGDRVERDQVLAVLRSVSLGEARAAVSSARAAVEVAQSNFQRQEELQREEIGSRRSHLEAQGELRRAQAELAAANERVRVLGGSGGSGSATSIRSPLDGVIIERHAARGEVVSADKQLFVVADLSRVWVVGRVYEQDVAAARLGGPATVHLQAYPDRRWEGVVGYVASTLDSHTRTLAIRVELDNPDGVLRPGLFGTISLSPSGSSGEPVPVVPEDAVQRLGDRTVVFVPGTAAGEFRAVPIVVGARTRGRVVVTRGVDAGDRVVVSGTFTLKSELLRAEIGEGHAH